MEQYISKSALVAEIEKLYNGEIDTYTRNILDRLKSNIDTLKVKEVDFDTLGTLASHLIACDAHGIIPKYSEKELDFLEGLTSNKAQKEKQVMTDKEKKSKIADILLEFYEEYQCNMPNRPMIPSLYASKIIDTTQEEHANEELDEEEFVDTEEIINEIDPEHKVCAITDLEEAAMEYFKQTLYNGNDSKMQAFKAGANWQKENLWNPADGDELPEYEREVVVFTQNYPDDAGMMMVAIGHRPNPEGFDGKSLTTGEVEHYIPKTYDKGGWNIPNVVLWLDAKLPKEIEL